MAVILCGVLAGTSAQEQDTTIYEFRPHWYIHGAFGYQYTIGETKDALALSYMTAQIAAGYELPPFGDSASLSTVGRAARLISPEMI